MSLKIGTSVESHLSMICKQTTHFAILLSLFEKPRIRHRITPQCGQKKVRPETL